jgi:hypothetical protein
MLMRVPTMTIILHLPGDLSAGARRLTLRESQ